MKESENTPIIVDFFQRVYQFILRTLKQIRQKHLAFIFFIALSTVAWFVRSLSDTYIADIEYPVKYINLPPNRILSEPPLEKLTLQVQSDGLTILMSRFKIKRPLPYNVNTFALYSLTEDSTSVYTLTRYAKNRLSTELSMANKNIQILDIDPDTLIFNFSRVKKKKLPIRVQLDKTDDLFERQYMLNGEPYSEPDSIEVTGPSFIVDTLQYILTDRISLRNLSDTADKKVQLKKTNRVSMPNKKVRVTIPVDEFTESEFSIPIITKNVPDSLKLKTFPKAVQVKYIVTLTNYERVSSDLFHAYVDYSDTEQESVTHLKVELDSLPDYIPNVRIIPRNVEFLIEK